MKKLKNEMEKEAKEWEIMITKILKVTL
jgi:hypothetical protein